MELERYVCELLRSYRLLFGKDKNSRELFRKLQRRCTPSTLLSDPVLAELCLSSVLKTSTHIPDRNTYQLLSLFPIHHRILRLKAHLDARKPMGWRELWHDRRDSGEWSTFWAVLWIGGVGLCLSILSLGVSVLQLWRQWG
jgi:hypothetical protein